MDSASAWPVRQIRPNAGKVPRIISVVKIKMVGQTLHAIFLIRISLHRSNFRTINEENYR
jgi:hypothetical protein